MTSFEINDEIVSNTYSIYANLYDNSRIPLFSYKSCNSYDCDLKLENLISIYNDKLKKLTNNELIKSISFCKDTYYNQDHYINILKKPNSLITKRDMIDIDNFLYNIGFSDKLNAYDSFNYSNMIHCGILISLLTYSKYPTTEPFYPLSNYPEYIDKVEKQILLWERALLDILEKTK